MKKIKRHQAQSQIDYNLLKDDTYKRRYNILVKNYYDVLGSEKVEQDHESEEEHVEKEWSKVKLSLQNAAKELLPKKVKKKKRGWMNDEILSKMEQRKNVKNKTTEYNVINNEIVDECRQERKLANEQCEEIESLEKQHKTKEMYDKVKELTKKCTLKGGGSITDKNGKFHLIKKKLIRDGLNI